MVSTWNSHAAKATNSYERKLKVLIGADLLIIYEFDLMALQSPQDEDFHAVIAERYERRSAIVTSNLDFDERGLLFQIKS